AVYEALELQARQKIESIEHELTTLRNTVGQMTAELRAAQSERMLMASEMKQAIFEKQAAERELRHLEAASASENIQALQGQVEAVRQELEAVRESARRDEEATARRVAADRANMEAALHQERLIRAGIMRSVSWRVTAPARWLMNSLRTAMHVR